MIDDPDATARAVLRFVDDVSPQVGPQVR